MNLKKNNNNRDTFSLFRSPEAFRKLIDLFSDHIVSLGNIDAVVGLEARGFVIGSAISYKLGIPFVPIRKKGKLPGDVISYKYELEYGSVRVLLFKFHFQVLILHLTYKQKRMCLRCRQAALKLAKELSLWTI